MTAPLLVVAHEATRTGSPKVLLDLLRYTIPRLEVPVAVRLLAGGELAADLRSVATAPDDGSLPAGVVVNGALAASVLVQIGPVPSLVYVHEEGDALRFLGRDAVDGLIEHADTVLCVSEASRRDLIELGVDAERVAVLPPLVSAVTRPSPDAIAAARTEIGIDPDVPLVVGCGEAGWRKGTDLFVATAQRIAEHRPAHFVWVGRRGRGFSRVLSLDARLSGLGDRLHWIDEVADAVPYLAVADLLMMTSREDPQPLVPMEAAWVDTPTVGFAIGGLVDLAGAGSAVVVEFPDVNGLAEAAVGLLDRPDDGARLVAACLDRSVGLQSIEVVGPAFVAACRGLLDDHVRQGGE